MGIELNIYETPKLITDVKAGQILEALPGAVATAVKEESKPTKSSPTNVFGYVRGMLLDDITGPNRTYVQGDVLVERIVPQGVGYVYCIAGLSEWAPKKNQVYMAIGELGNIGNIIPNSGDIFYNLLETKAVILPGSENEYLKERLLGFSRRRGQKDYVFESPDGHTYSLRDVLLFLKEK